MTKEWFNTFRRAAIINWLDPDPLTAQVDEKHYQERYQEKLKQHLSSYEPYDRELSEAIDNIFYKKIRDELGEEKAKIFRGAYMTEEGYKEEESYKEFEREKAVQEFDNWQSSLVAVCETLPSEIKDKIADIRMIALGRATQEVIDELKDYCAEQREISESTLEMVRKRNVIEEEKTSLGKEILRQNEELEEFARSDLARQLVNEVVKGIRWESNNLIIDFTEWGILIKDAELIEQEEPIIDALIFEHETYCENGEIEFHLLAVGNNGRDDIPLYLTVRGADILFSDN